MTGPGKWRSRRHGAGRGGHELVPRGRLRAALEWLWRRGNRAGRIAKLKGGKADRKADRREGG